MAKNYYIYNMTYEEQKNALIEYIADSKIKTDIEENRKKGILTLSYNSITEEDLIQKFQLKKEQIDAVFEGVIHDGFITEFRREKGNVKYKYKNTSIGYSQSVEKIDSPLISDDVFKGMSTFFIFKPSRDFSQKYEKHLEKLERISLGIKYDIRFIENKEQPLLCINDVKIKIKKFSDQYHFLRIIFLDKKEFSKEWFFSEIAERVDPTNKVKDKKYYNAVYQIENKLKATEFTDFFITTNQHVQINPNYINKK
jgi:hypothetical protein